jgi:hypothetical protein
MCAPAAMARSAMQVSSAGSEGARRDRRWGEGHGVTARQACGGGRRRKNERPCYFGRWADKHTREYGFVFFLREMGPAPAKPRPDGSHGRMPVPSSNFKCGYYCDGA